MTKVIAPPPSYQDGYTKGYYVALRQAEEDRLASIFDRDQAHVEALAVVVRGVLISLGRVGACTAQDQASRFARDLMGALDRLATDYSISARKHREEAARQRAEDR